MMKLRHPSQIVLHYRLATPMFLGGEDQKADKNQFRNASYKGALRFWWRALNWGAALKKEGNPEAALRHLHQREGEVFGLASDGNNSKQSRVQIHSEMKGVTVSKANLPNLTYLLGMGLYNYKENMLRDYLQGGSLTIHLSFKPNATDEDIQSVQQAAIALGLFGGLGSRARKGFGSLSLQKIEYAGHKEQSFTTETSIQEFINSLDFSAPAGAPLSALSQATRIDISTSKKSALDALAAINAEQQMYRGYGRNNPRTGVHEVNGQKALQKFRPDHDAVQAASQGGALQALPQRAVFGLPHNYFFSSTGTKLDINVENEARRASPLLVHIHALEDEQYIAIQILLHSQFLPQGLRVEAKRDRAAAQNIPSIAVDYGVITRYMDGFGNHKTLRAAQA